MIGNDIVDLKLAAVESNWQRKGFLDKQFALNEQLEIRNAEDPMRMLWLLWSMKESAYKVHVQQYGQRFFAPKRFECQYMGLSKGEVKIDGNLYTTTSTISSDYVFSTAKLAATKKSVANHCFHLADSSPEEQSQSTRNYVMHHISQKCKIPLQDLAIRKSAIGVPAIYQNDRALEISFSMTHHGQYGAISILNASA